jgi:hypothetical protein
MNLGCVERVSAKEPLSVALSDAFASFRDAGLAQCALAFDPDWRPTMDLVDLVASELADGCEDISQLTLIHPSSAMTFIASALGLRAPSVHIVAQRSVYDEQEDLSADATASKTMFVMGRDEGIELFLRRAVREAQARSVRRFALILDGSYVPTLDAVDVLAEELMLGGGVQEIGLIHPTASLDTLVAGLHLRLPTLRVAHSSAPQRGAK